MNEIVEFNCPKCGGHTWGTVGCTEPPGQQTGYCNGYVPRLSKTDGAVHIGSCGFSWPRTEDWKVFRFVRVPTSAADMEGTGLWSGSGDAK